jgi:hypothetical protein
MAVTTFGVEVADVAAEIHGFRPTETSTPSIAQIERYIKDAAGYWGGLLASLGVTVSAFDEDEEALGYATSRSYVLAKACARTVRANERNATPVLDSFEAEAERIEAKVTKRPQLLMEGRPLPPGPSTMASHVTLARRMREPRTLGGRMARRGEL